jgi:voltage-gated potassium channel
MLDKIDILYSHTIICGYGRHAKEVCKELSKQNLPFVVIEKNEERIAELRNERSSVFIEGDATQDEILQEAGIEHAHAIIVTLADDSDNLFVVLTARQLNAQLHIISRAVDKRAESKLLRAGANHVVMPERIGGFYMATLAHKPDLVEFFTLLSNITPGNVAFEEINCADLLPEYIGKTIQSAAFRASTGANIIGIKTARGEYELNPLPNTVLVLGMYIIILGKREQINNFKLQALRK